MKILFIASECAPFAKVGGLADVTASLPKALKEINADVSVVIPFYEPIKIEAKLVKEGIPVEFEGEKETFDLYQTFLPGQKAKTPLYLIKNEKYISDGGIYPEDDASSGGTPKEAKRFLFFSLASIEAAKILGADILHCHDWHVAVIPYLARKYNLPAKTIITIHNIGYQGIYKKEIASNLLAEDFQPELNCLRVGIQSADLVTTVSPNYAKEILTPEFGFGLEKDLVKKKESLLGIVNGLDYDEFNPETDSFIAENYTFESLDLRQKNRELLVKKCFQGKTSPKPIISIITRLADQKGIDLIKKIFPDLIKKNFQFALLGKGAKEYEEFFEKMAKEHPQLFFAKLAFDEELARQIYAGADIFLMPSYYEPCGLGQLIAMRYGSVPVARSIGGIKDTVKQVQVKGDEVEGNGFLFDKYLAEDLLKTIVKSAEMFEDKNTWRQIQLNGMSTDFSWQKSAEKYLKVYRGLFNG